VAELGCGSDDLIVDKARFDAFQWTSLEPLLRGLNINDLVVCGVVTNLCVETTIRSAFMRDFPVTLLADCCAAQTRRLHDLSLEVLSAYRLARIESITEGFDLAEAEAEAEAEAVPITA
jgi:ureidoacrylate peracid hydrolase